MIPFYSKRNQVYPRLFSGRPAVEKHFYDLSDWQRERELYALLAGKLPVPTVLAESPGTLILEYYPCSTLLFVLEEQEKGGFHPLPWQQLALWLQKCRRLCGKLPTDGNLRNFLWDPEAGRILGLDLESYAPSPEEECGAALTAALTLYDPADTPVKKQAAAILADRLGIPPALTASARQRLLERRKGFASRQLSGIILAGGMSRRMGRHKAELTLLGEPLLRLQAEKLRQLGIEDIMISGPFSLPGARAVPDEYPDRGPLGGLHACLRAARCAACLVLSVDAPLVPAVALSHLCRAHTEGVTVLRHGDKLEPLMGVYDSALYTAIEPLIARRGAPVRALWDVASLHCFDYLGPEELLDNCNTPEDLARIEALAAAYRGVLLPCRTLTSPQAASKLMDTRLSLRSTQ